MGVGVAAGASAVGAERVSVAEVLVCYQAGQHMALEMVVEHGSQSLPGFAVVVAAAVQSSFPATVDHKVGALAEVHSVLY